MSYKFETCMDLTILTYSKLSIIRPGRSRLLEFEIEIVLVF